MNRLDTPFPLTLEEYNILELLIKNDYSCVKFFDRKKIGNKYVSFCVNNYKKIDPNNLRKLRRINSTIKTKYYWCEKECDFLYFYELNRNNNFKKIKTIKLIRNKNERYFSVNQELSQFNLNEKNLFIRLNEDNFSEIKLIFQNRFLIDQFKILNQYKNCYVIKK